MTTDRKEYLHQYYLDHTFRRPKMKVIEMEYLKIEEKLDISIIDELISRYINLNPLSTESEQLRREINIKSHKYQLT